MIKLRYPLIALLSLLCLAIAPATQPAYITPDQFDFKTILPDPPRDDSPFHQVEIDIMLALQQKRTPEDELRCKAEEEVTVFAFATVLGNWFNADDLPATRDLMQQVYDQARAVSSAAKKQWKRKRPPLADARIMPCVVLEKSDSYPSGHAVRGVVWATILAEMFPEHRAELMARGRQIGEDRFLAGMHYPTDVIAGQVLGAEIAKRLLANDAFKAAMEKAKDECAAGAKGH